MKNYHVAMDSDAKAFHKKVQDFIDNGYIPQGGLGLILQNGEAYHYQALFKPPTKKTRKRKVVEYESNFQNIWITYPKRAGSNPKLVAYAAYKKCLISDPPTVMFAGVVRYRQFCESTGKINTEYVMQAATFFGPEKHYLNDWEIPADNQMPQDNTKLVAWAIERFGDRANPTSGPPGETMAQYRARLRGML